MIDISRILAGTVSVLCLAASASPQSVRGFLLGGEFAGTEKGAMPRVIVTTKVLGRNLTTTTVQIPEPDARDGKVFILANLSRPAPLSNIEYIRFDLIPDQRALAKIPLKKIVAAPILDFPGFPRSFSRLGFLLGLTSEGESIREFFGFPAMAAGQAEATLAVLKPVTMRFTRNDMPGPAVRSLRTRLGILDGVRDDSSVTLALSSYDGRLLKVDTGAFRDGSRHDGEISLPIPIGPKHFASLQAFFLQSRFEDGGPLSAPPLGAAGDDARFSFTLESSPGDRIHRMTSLSLTDTTNSSFRFPDAYQQTPGAFWCDALSIWVQTGERGLPPGVPVQLSLHLKGGQILTANLPVAGSSFKNAARSRGCGSFMLWLSGLRLAQERRLSSEPGDPPVDGFPIHALEKITLSILRPSSGAPAQEAAWDIKAIIITAGRGSGTFPIWADGLERVNLLSLPNWNKTLRMEGTTGPPGSAFQHSVLTPKRVQSYTFTLSSE